MIADQITRAPFPYICDGVLLSQRVLRSVSAPNTACTDLWDSGRFMKLVLALGKF
jgi:hypothetical protein